jgi:environmental stress-induced protein Ves
VISVLRAADRIAVPWKNGGGVTREVAVSPAGSSFENFDWRVSIAEIHVAGPFSRFESIDRTLMVLKGRLALEFADGEVELDTVSPPYAFAGEVACSGRPIDGAVTDLNVMIRRGRAAVHVTAVAGETHSESAKTSLFVARSETNVRIGKAAFHLGPLDALLVGEPCEASLDGAAFAIAIG